MSSGDQEPGVNLGRLVAVERNVATAIQGVKEYREGKSESERRFVALEAEIVQLKQANASLSRQLNSLRGTGSTS